MTTRRGFLGRLAALAAMPFALLRGKAKADRVPQVAAWTVPEAIPTNLSWLIKEHPGKSIYFKAGTYQDGRCVLVRFTPTEIYVEPIA